MEKVPYYLFTLPPSTWRKKPSRSTFRMTIEEAATRYPGAEPILESVEYRSAVVTPITAEAAYQKRS